MFFFPKSDERRDLVVYVFHWDQVVLPGAAVVALPVWCRCIENLDFLRKTEVFSLWAGPGPGPGREGLGLGQTPGQAGLACMGQGLALSVCVACSSWGPDPKMGPRSKDNLSAPKCFQIPKMLPNATKSIKKSLLLILKYIILFEQ